MIPLPVCEGTELDGQVPLDHIAHTRKMAESKLPTCARCNRSDGHSRLRGLRCGRSWRAVREELDERHVCGVTRRVDADKGRNDIRRDKVPVVDDEAAHDGKTQKIQRAVSGLRQKLLGIFAEQAHNEAGKGEAQND